jgi:hypothetical protein
MVARENNLPRNTGSLILPQLNPGSLLVPLKLALDTKHYTLKPLELNTEQHPKAASISSQAFVFIEQYLVTSELRPA